MFSQVIIPEEIQRENILWLVYKDMVQEHTKKETDDMFNFVVK